MYLQYKTEQKNNGTNSILNSEDEEQTNNDKYISRQVQVWRG